MKREEKHGTFMKIKGFFRERYDGFCNNESGMELLQLAIVIVISVMLIAAVALIATNTNNVITSSGNTVGDLSDSLNKGDLKGFLETEAEKAK